MPHIDLANVACGFHAGDPVVMATPWRRAKRHGVEVGAHPSYPGPAGLRPPGDGDRPATS